jgi:ferritin
MGASEWKYFVPYKENLQEALNELRQKEFESGKYYRPGSNFPDTFEEWVTQINIPKEQWPVFKESFYELKKRSEIIPATIEELFELNQESGTHSIIDIFEINNNIDENESGTISDNELIRLFGTNKPNRQMIEDKVDELLEFRGRFLCTYIIVYKNNEPDEIFFTGFSGD